MVLVSPYLFDRDAIYYRKENKYYLVKYNKKFFVRYHVNKIKDPITVVGQVKNIINPYKKLILMIVKHQEEKKPSVQAWCG